MLAGAENRASYVRAKVRNKNLKKEKKKCTDCSIDPGKTLKNYNCNVMQPSYTETQYIFSENYFCIVKPT